LWLLLFQLEPAAKIADQGTQADGRRPAEVLRGKTLGRRR
jgi:hypothetical protein